MGIKATIMIDDDRWAKHPYGVNSREQCYRVIEKARAAGYNIDADIEEYFY